MNISETEQKPLRAFTALTHSQSCRQDGRKTCVGRVVPLCSPHKLEHHNTVLIKLVEHSKIFVPGRRRRKFSRRLECFAERVFVSIELICGGYAGV